MNIFVLDTDVKKCAKYHCDKHIVKMILETAQLLCSAVWISGEKAPYKLTHKNHPCSIWVRESLDNWMWLKKLGLELSKEYTRRYGKIHKSQLVIESLYIPKLKKKGLTKFVLAMPEEYKTKNVVQSYRNYYIHEKNNIAKWKLGNIPKWFTNKGASCL